MDSGGISSRVAVGRGKMTRLIRTALLGLAIAIAEVGGGNAQTVTGAGTILCGEWTQVRSFEGRDGNHNKEMSGSYQLRAWIDGYVSGANVGKKDGPDFMVSTPPGAAYYAWVDNYCGANPLDYLAIAAHALVDELQSRAGHK